MFSKRFFNRNARINFNYYVKKLNDKNKINNDCKDNIDFEKKFFFEYTYYGILFFFYR